MNPTSRFSNKVVYYIKYRPSYPPGIFQTLSAAGWREGQAIADIGSGTGILTSLLLQRGNTVYAVEPNEAMREGAESLLSGAAAYHSIDGTAEQTSLPDSSVDGVTAAQAFHWFERERAKQEFRRILKPGGWLALLWNDRVEDATPFSRAYERLLHELSVDYAAVRERDVAPAEVADFFAPFTAVRSEFPNAQSFDFEGALGRLMSSSYAPQPGHEKYEPIVAAMRRIFDEHQKNGLVRFEYRTVVYAGRFNP